MKTRQPLRFLLSLCLVFAMLLVPAAATGENETITISDAAGLADFRDAVNAGDTFEGKTVQLTADIDLSGVNWTPIGYFTDDSNNTNDAPFKGVFDGQDKTIRNLTINAPELNCVGLFGYAVNAEIKNVRVENVDILGYSQVATIVGRPYSGCTVSNCHVTGDISLTAEYAYVGGIAGYGYLTVEDCSVIADENAPGQLTTKDKNAIGGITAWLLEDSSSMTNCHVNNLTLTGYSNLGGLTGFLHRDGVIDGCSVENVTLNKTRVNGLAGIGLASGGWNYNAAKPAVIKNSTFTNLTCNGTYTYNPNTGLLYGSEYYGNTSVSVTCENNTTAQITDNLELVADNAASLTAALTGKQDGKTVTLLDDITLTETVTVPADSVVT